MGRRGGEGKVERRGGKGTTVKRQISLQNSNPNLPVYQKFWRVLEKYWYRVLKPRDFDSDAVVTQKTPFKHSKMDYVEIGTENKDLIPCFIIHLIDHRYYMVPTKAVLSIWEAVANTAAKTHTRWTWGCLSRIPALERQRLGIQKFRVILGCIASSRTVT